MKKGCKLLTFLSAYSCPSLILFTLYTWLKAPSPIINIISLGDILLLTERFENLEVLHSLLLLLQKKLRVSAVIPKKFGYMNNIDNLILVPQLPFLTV